MCTSVFKQILELSGDKRMFKGLYASQYEFLVENLWRFFPNATLTSSSKLGDRNPKTMMFDGCLGRLQRNESDVTLRLAIFPVLGTGMIHGTTVRASKVAMWSAYNNTAIPSDTDVMDAFKSFSRPLWSLTILTTAILTIVVFMIFRFKLLSLPESKAKLKKRQRTRRCMDQALLIVTANVLKQHTSYSFRGKLLRRRMILFLFAVFSFLIMYYFSSMIKTEMVVQKSPKTISSYEELLANPKTKPLWPKNLNLHWAFMNANKKTAEGRIWERAKKIGIDHCFLTSAGDIKKNTAAISRQEAVMFGSSNTLSIMITKACAFHHTSGHFSDVNMWLRADANAREKLNVMMLSSALHPVKVKKFNRIIQADFEHQLMYKAMKRVEFSVFTHSGRKSVRDCVAYRIIYPDYEMAAVHLPYFHRLWLLSGCFLLFSLLALSSEMVCNMYRRLASEKRPFGTAAYRPNGNIY